MLMLLGLMLLQDARAPLSFKPLPQTFQVAWPVVHRGQTRVAPENTIPALQACIADFLPWAQVDVRLTQDGQHVLLHDSTLDRTTTGQGSVQDKTLQQIQALDAGSWFSTRYSLTRVPTLREALELAHDKLTLYLDCHAVSPALLVQEVKAAGMEKQVIVFGSLAITDEVSKLSHQRIAVMTRYQPGIKYDQLSPAQRPAAVEVNAEDVTSELGKSLEAAGIRVLVNCLGTERDTPAVWKKLLAQGQRWILTDDPAGLLMLAARTAWPVFPVKIACHRGAQRYAPENTLPAFQEAIRLGIDYVEMDIRTSQDGQLFILHDSGLQRTTGVAGKISSTPSDKLLSLDAGSWFGKRWAKTPLPRFEQVLDAFDSRVAAYLDAKDIAPEALSQMIHRHRLEDKHVVYQSLDYLKRLKAIDPQARAMPPLRRLADLDQVAALKPYAVDANWNILSKQLIDDCHRRGIQVFSDALGLYETQPHYGQAMEWGIDVIQTDHPLRVLRAVERKMMGK